MKKIFGSKKGWSLIELTIVIAIIAILATVTMKGYGWVQQTRVSSTSEQIRTIRSASINWKATQGKTDYTGLSIAGLKTLNLVSSTDDTNKFGGANTVTPTGNTIKIVAAGVPASPAYNQMVVDMCNNSYFGAGTCVLGSTATNVECTFAD